MKWLADENFPFPAFRVLEEAGFDIEHIGIEAPSTEDTSVMEAAIAQNRVVMTFDSDFGELVFRYGFSPPGVIYFRLTDFQITDPAMILIRLLEEGYHFLGYFTVVGQDNVRQRGIPVLS